jgi:hypothetical protein
MISKGYTHKGLGHASYGLAAMIPHVPSVQVFGGLMVIDKVWNLNSLAFPPNGTKIFKREDALNDYGTDNLFVDNLLKMKTPTALAVNIPFMVLSGILYVVGLYVPKVWYLQYIGVINILLGVIAGVNVWILKYKV